MKASRSERSADCAGDLRLHGFFPSDTDPSRFPHLSHLTGALDRRRRKSSSASTSRQSSSSAGACRAARRRPRGSSKERESSAQILRRFTGRDEPCPIRAKHKIARLRSDISDIEHDKGAGFDGQQGRKTALVSVSVMVTKYVVSGWVVAAARVVERRADATMAVARTARLTLMRRKQHGLFCMRRVTSSRSYRATVSTRRACPDRGGDGPLP